MVGLPAQERREQLVAAAIEIASEEGFDAATTRRVAKRAGVAVGVVHYCFGTKANLFREVIRVFADEMVTSVASVAQPGDDLREHLSRAVEAYCSAVEAEPDKHRLTYELTAYAARTPGLADLGDWQYRCYLAATSAFFETTAEAAGVTWTVPIETLARMLLALNDGLTLAWLVDRRGDQIRAVYATFVDQLVAMSRPVDGEAASVTADLDPEARA